MSQAWIKEKILISQQDVKEFTNFVYFMQYALSIAELSSMQPAACMSNINLEYRLAL